MTDYKMVKAWFQQCRDGAAAVKAQKQMPSSTMMRMTCRFNHTRKEFRPWALTHPVALLPFPAV